MKIYTKTGDDGTTGLFGGRRVKKNDLRIDAYGTADELNALLGVVSSDSTSGEVSAIVDIIQHHLFTLGADLASPKEDVKIGASVPRVSEEMVHYLESKIDSLETKLPQLTSFILPGGKQSASYLHLARTVCRRAERLVVSLSKSVDIGSNIVIYLNRLSDLLLSLIHI